MTKKLGPGVLMRIVGALVVAQLFALWLHRPGPEKMTVTADFNRAGLNIRAGDEVRVRGLPVGSVKAILIDPRTGVLMGGVSPTGDSYVMAW